MHHPGVYVLEAVNHSSKVSWVTGSQWMVYLCVISTRMEGYMSEKCH